jgi:hypothetical protein
VSLGSCEITEIWMDESEYADFYIRPASIIPEPLQLEHILDSVFNRGSTFVVNQPPHYGILECEDCKDQWEEVLKKEETLSTWDKKLKEELENGDDIWGSIAKKYKK